MNVFRVEKTLNRLHKMIDHAIEGKPIENGFDESKLSALETRLSQYLAMNSATKAQLAEEKARIHALISDISHQTKTPISNILLYSQLLQERDLPKQEQEYVASLLEQAEKLHFLIASMVKASRLETGMISVAPKLCEVQALFEQVIMQAKPKAEQKGITFTCEPTEVKAVFDPKWTAEALYNLLDNAIKYTTSGGSVTLSATAYELFCRIDVRDTGIGIREEETAKVFIRFYRSQDVREEEGVGIGLYLAREIIASQGGYMKVSSEQGKGSTFSMFLPRTT